MNVDMIWLCIFFNAVFGTTSELWTEMENKPVLDGHILEMSIGLFLPNEDSIANRLLEIADPSSKNYGEYLSKEDIKGLFNCSDTSKNEILAVLERYGIQDDVREENQLDDERKVGYRFDHDYVHVRMNASTVEDMFNVNLKWYVHVRTDIAVIRPSHEIRLPGAWKQHVRIVNGMEQFPTEVQMDMFYKRKMEYNERSMGMTPAFIRKLYHVPENMSATHSRNQILFSSFLNEVYSDEDTMEYIKMNNIPVMRGPIADDTCKSSESTGEAALDTQLGIGVSWNNNSAVMCMFGLRDIKSEMNDANQEPFLKFMQSINALDQPPSVVSISYSDDECAIPPAYATSINLEFIKAGLRGITIVVASGDNGVMGSVLASYCHEEFCKKFQSSFPSSSPYVTSVGGTMHVPQQPEQFSEVVASSNDSSVLITSGGGFSNLFSRPAYQQTAVQKYISAQAIPHRFNSKGRGYPDVSALAHNIEVLESHDRSGFMDGTSASAPIVAGLFSLINKHRLDHHQPLLGFANPLLYQTYAKQPSSFRDIVQGNNQCGNKEQGCCKSGFAAIKGWDAATGLGSILVYEFIQVSHPTSVLLTQEPHCYAFLISAVLVCVLLTTSPIWRRIHSNRKLAAYETPLLP